MNNIYRQLYCSGSGKGIRIMLSVKNMKVGFRLGAAFSLVILLLIIVSVTAVIKISNINTAVGNIVNDR